MSTLAVGTIKSISSAAPVFLNSDGIEKGQLAKAWIKFNANNMTIQASFNVSSITDGETGKYDINFASEFSDANYAFTSMCSNDNKGLAIGSDTQVALTNKLRVIVSDLLSNNQAQDSSQFAVVIFR